MAIEPSSANLGASNLAAIIAQELASLADDARTLQSQLHAGDVVRAVVLSSNGLTDLLEINGLRVAAELPPSLLPGEQIAVEVIGFSDDRIELHIVPQTALAQPPSAGAPGRAPARAPAPVAAGDEPTAAARGVSQGAAGRTGAQTVHDARGPSAVTTALSRASAAAYNARSGAPAAAAALPAVGESGPLEARLAAARAAAARPAGAGPAAAVRSATGDAARRTAVGGGLGGPARPTVLGGNGTGLALPAAGATRSERPVIAARLTPAPVAGTAPRTEPEPVSVRGAAAFTEPGALLRGLGLALTPANLAAAREALDSPRAFPNALAELDRVLAAQADPQHATLHALTAFIARLSPSSPVLATQISAFVGALSATRDVKLAQLANAASAAGGAHPDRAAVAANAAAVRTALDADLPSRLLAVAAPDAQPAAPPHVVAAAAAVLTAVTALQVRAAADAGAQPVSIAFSVPLTTGDTIAHAHVRIDREAPGGGAPLDGDSFHVGFVLDTQHLGTVAIDVRSVGRGVSLTIAAEHERSRAAFDAALPALGARLTALNFRLASAHSVIAPRQAEPAPPPAVAVTADPRGPRHAVDYDA